MGPQSPFTSSKHLAVWKYQSRIQSSTTQLTSSVQCFQSDSLPQRPEDNIMQVIIGRNTAWPLCSSSSLKMLKVKLEMK